MKAIPMLTRWLALPGLMLFAGAALAAAPMQKTQAPGYYRLMLGDFEVTVLSDGTLPFDVQQLLTNITPQQLDAALARAFLKEPIDISVNAFLINTGTQLALIDTGTGGSFGPTVGRLLGNLEAAGYKPEQVDEIYITHMHGDHIGGLSQNGKAVFPNATVRASQAEADYWLSEAKMNAAPAQAQGGFKGAMAALQPYIAAKRFQPIQGDAQLIPGIRALAAPGHTPGHTLYLVTSKNENLLLWGDLMHVAAAQFPNPAVTIRFDSDSASAARERMKFFAEAAAKGYLVGGAHLSFPGLGHLRASGPVKAAAGGASGDGSAVTSYLYVPVAYALPH
jgi:glyoxylase-like metal-dependent hydrolase (beta-lactamase superfamily II)